MSLSHRAWSPFVQASRVRSVNVLKLLNLPCPQLSSF